MSPKQILRTTPAAEFYDGAGSALLDNRNYPPGIERHLDSERQLVRWIVDRSGYSTVVEVGCADGCVHLQTILRLGVRYFGIDVVPKFISLLNLRLQSLRADSSRGYLLDARHLFTLHPDLPPARTLILFSFNSFGNLEDPEAVIAQLAALRADILILTYRTDAGSCHVRQDYYGRCSLKNIRKCDDHRGVVFQSADGLHSYAYRRGWLQSMLRPYHLQCIVGEFGEIGRSFWAGPERCE